MNPGGLDWEARLPTTKLSLTYDLPYYTSVRPSAGPQTKTKTNLKLKLKEDFGRGNLDSEDLN